MENNEQIKNNIYLKNIPIEDLAYVTISFKPLKLRYEFTFFIDNNKLGRVDVIKAYSKIRNNKTNKLYLYELFGKDVEVYRKCFNTYIINKTIYERLKCNIEHANNYVYN